MTSRNVISQPYASLYRMLLFVGVIFIGAALLAPQILAAHQANVFLNSIILLVFFCGILQVFWRPVQLWREVKWVNTYNTVEPALVQAKAPRLLAPMAAILAETKQMTRLSTASMRSLMDSLSARLDESRDTTRYIISALVFLGLLGTFWGLLITVQSVGDALGTLSADEESARLFEELQRSLASPLRGMGTAFSSSLLGLGCSLILGFLDLQAAGAQNRFYNQVENWLSRLTHLDNKHEPTMGDVLKELKRLRQRLS